MSASKPLVRVGVGVFVMRQDKKILIGKRKGSHGNGTFQLPGGHLEFGETFEECAIREVKEEAGLDIHNLSFETATNDIFPTDNKHYVTVFMKGWCKDPNPNAIVMEPEKCEKWEWLSWEDTCRLRPLFKPLESLIKTRSNYRPDNSINSA
ncbi:NUDIX hydrolase domain-like protein [Paraphysoderma sedebokerense]|nr:NUDIX hydrolase domain-like protein [Paraphysoderma sedebokerense]